MRNRLRRRTSVDLPVTAGKSSLLIGDIDDEADNCIEARSGTTVPPRVRTDAASARVPSTETKLCCPAGLLIVLYRLLLGTPDIRESAAPKCALLSILDRPG